MFRIEGKTQNLNTQWCGCDVQFKWKMTEYKICIQKSNQSVKWVHVPESREQRSMIHSQEGATSSSKNANVSPYYG